MDVQVPQDVREARRDELVELQQHVGQSFAESLVGQQVLLNLPLLKYLYRKVECHSQYKSHPVITVNIFLSKCLVHVLYCTLPELQVCTRGSQPDPAIKSYARLIFSSYACAEVPCVAGLSFGR